MFGSRPCCALQRPHVTNLTAAGAGRQSAATAGPKGRRPTGLSNVGHRQAPNTKNPRGFADGGFLLPVKKYLQRRLIFQIYDLAHSDKL